MQEVGDHPKAPWHCDPANIVPAPSRVGDPNYVPEGGGAYRAAEKRYAGRVDVNSGQRRRKGPVEVDLTHVVDFTYQDRNTEANREQIEEVSRDQLCEGFSSEYFDAGAKMYRYKGVEGLYFIPNPFTEAQQRYWIKRCVKDFSVGNPTNVSNLQAIETGASTFFSEWKVENMAQLRWASLGYHYQWTPRVYTEEHRGNFPSDLFDFVRDAASLLGHNDMRAEAAIINYYPTTKCMMGGHLDDAEEAMHKPIVSCSFGNTIIFLIGGKTRDIEPTALFIRSGDIVLMAGHARYCFHGVPKMIPGTSPTFLSTFDPSSDINDPNWSPELAEYMKDARVNMNVRQVRISPQTPFSSHNNPHPQCLDS
jgi:alkylated DNA repair protein alkB family protein 1